MATIQDTVKQSMTSGIGLMYSIALLNRNSVLQQTYFDVENGVALAGYRRQVANFGVLLVAAQYGRDNEVHIGDNKYMRRNGLFHYVEKMYTETHEGLRGTEVKDGHYENVDTDVAFDKLHNIRDNAALRYEVDINPNNFVRFVDDRKREIGTDHKDKKVNMQCTAGIPVGTAIAMATRNSEGHVIMVAKVPGKGQIKEVPCYVDERSSINAKRIQVGRVYLIKPMANDREKGIRTVNVLQPYKSGIRFAVQNLNNGIIRPGDPGYILTPNNKYGVKKETIVDMPFMKHQDHKKIKHAPTLTFDLDMFYALMKTLSGYPSVTLQFKDSSTGVYFKAEGNEYMPNIEAIMGPTIQHIRGKVWLP